MTKKKEKAESEQPREPRVRHRRRLGPLHVDHYGVAHEGHPADIDERRARRRRAQRFRRGSEESEED